MEKVDYLEFVKKLDEIENYQEKVNLVNNILNHNITYIFSKIFCFNFFKFHNKFLLKYIDSKLMPFLNQ